MIDGCKRQSAGAHSDLVLKLFATDLVEARKLAEKMCRCPQTVPGSADMRSIRNRRCPQFASASVDRSSCSVCGINVSGIASLIEVAIGGKAVTRRVFKVNAYDVVAVLSAAVRSSRDTIGDLTIAAPSRPGFRFVPGAPAGAAFPAKVTITRASQPPPADREAQPARARSVEAFGRSCAIELPKKCRFHAAAMEVRWGGRFENQRPAGDAYGDDRFPISCWR